MVILVSILDPRCMFAAAASILKQNDTGEPPFDYTASRLVGAMKVGEGSVVVFENAKGEQTFYRMGETFPDGAKIVAVNTNSIIVKRPDGSKVEYFVSPGSAVKPGAASVGHSIPDSAATFIPPVTSAPAGVRKSGGPKRHIVRNSENKE
jgi:hypothetical protein